MCVFIWYTKPQLGTPSKDLPTFLFMKQFCHQLSSILFLCPWLLAQLLDISYYISLKVLVKVSVVQSCLTLCGPMVCSLPDSSVHGILQARILEWVAIPFSRGSSWPRDQTQVSCIADRFFARYLSHQRSSYILLTLVISTLTKWIVTSWVQNSAHWDDFYSPLIYFFGFIKIDEMH